MKRASEEELQDAARVCKQHVHFMKWLQDWRQQELEALPLVTNNTALAQGRCQVLGELIKQLHCTPGNKA